MEPEPDTPEGILIPTSGMTNEQVAALLSAFRDAMLIGNDDEDESDEE